MGVTVSFSLLFDALDSPALTLTHLAIPPRRRIPPRSKHLFILGLSLSPLFDIPQGMDFVKTTLRVLDEWEAWTEGGAGKGMVSPARPLTDTLWRVDHVDVMRFVRCCVRAEEPF